MSIIFEKGDIIPPSEMIFLLKKKSDVESYGLFLNKGSSKKLTKQEKAGLTYSAASFGDDVRIRTEKLLGVGHPYFGKFSIYGNLDTEEAVMCGYLKSHILVIRRLFKEVENLQITYRSCCGNGLEVGPYIVCSKCYNITEKSKVIKLNKVDQKIKKTIIKIRKILMKRDKK